MARQRGMGRSCGAKRTRLAPTAFRRADPIHTVNVWIDVPQDYRALVAWSPQERCKRTRSPGRWLALTRRKAMESYLEQYEAREGGVTLHTWTDVRGVKKEN